ncbi:tRNA(Ile)(2)-agmatinylcytidine synthase [Halorhabdus sp. BNX81]|uniref:tRNA(Ile)(2)-agmatinylcytidine synthase n=1 Tax=Halorhabdus sp. BNX81 TaxID=2980181 RepID=UPI0023DD3258|nr:tRNA(Ile)(2)-agmatinylcytidine synthase [Halorhabdus sp. BNX81]WEL22735.1 tRNA(Ile2) 2-agmatinylcytidine synthetase [Halorhabdus sp. BNX81]
MTVIGIDDTDSRTAGMCTTYLAARTADRLAADWALRRRVLVRLNPAVEHKTRGNAALAIHTDAPVDAAREVVRDELPLAETDDPRTNPGVVLTSESAAEVPEAVGDFARDAVRDFHDVADARALIDRLEYDTLEAGNGRGLIGALAALGAWRAFDEWTYEHISYREVDRRGTPREVDAESVFAAAEAGYPDAWDTVDRDEGELVCVPHAPGPILHGIRGDDADVVREVAADIESESIERTALFVTNQGTDAHLRKGAVETVRDGRAYRVTGTVTEPPETREGGHVFLTIAGEGGEDLPCAAFEPTKRFRDRVRALRVGDRVTVCGEVGDGTLKLEKFAVRDLVETERVTPTCPDCGRTMESAGRGQGYRCRDCGTTAAGKAEREIDRELEVGWYEVPPCARRHIAKPLVRGGYDAPVHPER